mgnify:CR=1 FL=1
MAMHIQSTLYTVLFYNRGDFYNQGDFYNSLTLQALDLPPWASYVCSRCI